jgi:Cof subfamily protein (haloacid dehalogenase superfamily)
MIRVIATDLDGTLFYPRRRRKMIPRKNIELIKSFISEGGRIVLVSGRSFHYAEKVFEVIGQKVDFIGCNSAVMYVNDQIVDEVFLPSNFPDIFHEIQTKYHLRGYMLMSKNVPLALETATLPGPLRLFYNVYYRFQGIYRENYAFDQKVWKRELHSGQIYKFMLYFGLTGKGKRRAMEANKYIRATYPMIESSWSNGFIEITGKNISKAEGLKKYCRYLNIAQDDIIVVGDSGNDISMFNAFYENSYCMDHASEKVKKYAKHTLKQFSDLSTIVLKNRSKD